MNKKYDKRFILAGDIGGTKTDIGIFEKGKNRPVTRVIESFPSKKASSLIEIIESFLSNHNVSLESAYFGIAGPVINGRCKTTNLPWDVSEVQIKKNFEWKNVRLINDLEAMVRAVPLLNNRELDSLNKVRLKKDQNIMLIAPGTGLGVGRHVYAGLGWIRSYSPYSTIFPRYQDNTYQRLRGSSL